MVNLPSKFRARGHQRPTGRARPEGSMDGDDLVEITCADRLARGGSRVMADVKKTIATAQDRRADGVHRTCEHAR